MDLKYILIRFLLLPLIIIICAKLQFIKLIVNLLMKLFVRKNRMVVVRTPEERFRGLEDQGYNFAPRYAELPIGGGKTLPRVHYLDEGPRDARDTVLCLHGEPSWSFLYRHMIPGLVAAGHRVIVPDFIGFGKSDKYTHPEEYTHALHTMTIRLLLDHLKVSNVTLVCQDWGGLTGLSVVKDCPALFSRLVIMNTGLPVGKFLNIKTLGNSTPFLTWRMFALLVGTAMPVRYVFKLVLRSPSSKVLDAYAAPFPTMDHTAGPAQWPLLVPITGGSLVSGDMRQTRDFLQNGWKGSSLIMFSDDDPITGAEAKTFRKMLPRAKEITIRGGGHFIQEQKGVELAANIVKFINESN